MDYAKESLRLHREWKGKVGVVSKVKLENKEEPIKTKKRSLPKSKKPKRGDKNAKV